MSAQIRKILKQREVEHGDFYSNFSIIGKIWGALLGIKSIEAYKVALMMDALKTVRAFKNPEYEDNWLDKVGYTQHARSCVLYDKEQNK